MIHHTRYQQMLVVREELSPREREKIDRHTARCAECRQALRLCTANRATLAGLASPPAPSALQQSVLDRIQQASAPQSREAHTRPRPMRWSRALALATLALAMLGAIFASPLPGAVAQLFHPSVPGVAPILPYKLNLITLDAPAETASVTQPQAEHTVLARYAGSRVRQAVLATVRARPSLINRQLCWVVALAVPTGTASGVPPVGTVVEPGQDLLVFVDAHNGTVLMAYAVPTPGATIHLKTSPPRASR